MDKKRANLTMPSELMALIMDIAKDERRNISSMIRVLIELGIKEYQNSKK